MNDPDLPEDEYSNRIVAVIAYGWESREYYARWIGDDDPKILRELQGPVLNLLSQQSELAPALLKKVEWVLQDKRYLARIKRHYKMFRATVDNAAREPERSRATKVGRNDPCPCGSGKKYKRCCGQFP
jgi:uncharacterized protein YecA (UPF0149 family)